LIETTTGIEEELDFKQYRQRKYGVLVSPVGSLALFPFGKKAPLFRLAKKRVGTWLAKRRKLTTMKMVATFLI